MDKNLSGAPLLSTKPQLRRHSTLLKMAAIIVLVLVLLIPLAMVRSVLSERLARRDATVSEITSTWGREQVVVGPVLILPYAYRQEVWKDHVVKGKVERVAAMEMLRGRAFFLPAQFNASGTINPSRLYRGIYEAVVYSGTLELSGRFHKPSFEEWQAEVRQIFWDEAEVAVAISDLRGAKESLSLKIAEQSVPLMPGSGLKGFESTIHARVKGLNAEMDSIPFSMSFTLNGSHGLRFAPVGVNNNVRLSSSWPDPKFQGAFLPSEREVTSNGFSARWQVPFYGRSYPQQWRDKSGDMQGPAFITSETVAPSLFGVDLVPLLDSYRYVERSIKYGILLIALMFTAFFLYEILSSVRIHPFQYTLVGVALCLFYLGLIAVSEVTSFGTAYWIGAAAATLMVALYSTKILKSARRGGAVAVGLAAIYGFLFVILRLQDYSLLVGTAGLFLVLAIVMYVTRNIDWYARDNE